MALPVDSGITADPQARAAILKPVPNNVLDLGVKAHAANPGLGSSSSINSGLATSSQLPDIGAEIKQTDHNALTGSNKGDHRVPAAPIDMSFASDPAGPRGRVPVPVDNSKEIPASAPTITDSAAPVGD